MAQFKVVEMNGKTVRVVGTYGVRANAETVRDEFVIAAGRKGMTLAYVIYAEAASGTVWHPGTRRHGQIVCATSPHADGSERVIVEWSDGTESKVVESELRG